MDWIMQTLTQLGGALWAGTDRLCGTGGGSGADKRESEGVPETPKIQPVSAKAEAILCLRNMRYFRCFELHRQVGMMKKRKNVHGRVLLWGNSGGSIQGAAAFHPAVGRHADHDG